MNNIELHRIIRKELKDLVNFVEGTGPDDSIFFRWKTVKENNKLMLYITLESFTNLTVKMQINNNKKDKENLIDMCNTFKNLLFRQTLLNKY